jgi:colanic acid/amylovoran biosynthesis glycosyltransferase
VKILYIATNFTAITHTFITREVAQLQAAGHQVDLLSVRTHTEQEGARNPECDLTSTARIYPAPVWRVAGGVLRTLLTRPGRFFAGLRVIRDAREDPLRNRLKLGYQLAVATTVAPAVAEAGYARIHAHFASSPTTFALFLHLLTGVPYSFTGHAADIFREGTALRAKLEHAADVVAISGYNHAHYARLVPGLRTVRIHCGIDPEAFAFRERRAPGSPLRLLAVGRSVPKKGFADLLAALPRLSEAGLAWTCDIVGGGPLEARLRDQAERLGLTDLTLHGALQQDQVRELLDAADLFVLPCVVAEDGDRDNIPVSLMEAMAVGCPVISTDVAGIPELLGEHDEYGVSVPQRDPEALARAILDLVADPGRYAAYSRAGREQVERAFNVRRSADDLGRLFGRASDPVGGPAGSSRLHQ